MQKNDDLERENQALRNRLSRLSEASLHINESLDLDAVLQGVLDSARSLTDASYALSATLDGSGRVEDFRVSGLNADEADEKMSFHITAPMRFRCAVLGTWGILVQRAVKYAATGWRSAMLRIDVSAVGGVGPCELFGPTLTSCCMRRRCQSGRAGSSGPPASGFHQPAPGGRGRLHVTTPHHRGRRRRAPHALRAGRCRLQPSLHRPPFRPDVLRRRRRLRRPRTVRAATGPGHRSPLYRSSHLAARFALGLATGQEGATSTTSTAAPRSPASRSPTGWSRIRSCSPSATPCWSNSANWVWAIRWPSPRPTSRPSSPATTGRSFAA